VLVIPGRVVAGPSEEVHRQSHLGPPEKPADSRASYLCANPTPEGRISGVVKSRMRGADAYSTLKNNPQTVSMENDRRSTVNQDTPPRPRKQDHLRGLQERNTN